MGSQSPPTVMSWFRNRPLISELLEIVYWIANYVLFSLGNLEVTKAVVMQWKIKNEHVKQISFLLFSYGALAVYLTSVSSLFFIRYMYSDEIELAADTVLATLYAAKKYLVSALARACVGFLETSLEARNACVLLSQSRLFEEPELMQMCWEVIDAQAELALRSEGFHWDWLAPH